MESQRYYFCYLWTIHWVANSLWVEIVSKRPPPPTPTKNKNTKRCYFLSRKINNRHNNTPPPKKKQSTWWSQYQGIYYIFGDAPTRNVSKIYSTSAKTNIFLFSNVMFYDFIFVLFKKSTSENSVSSTSGHRQREEI